MVAGHVLSIWGCKQRTLYQFIAHRPMKYIVYIYIILYYTHIIILVHIYICIYICIYIYVYIYVHTHTYIYTYNMYMYMCIYYVYLEINALPSSWMNNIPDHPSKCGPFRNSCAPHQSLSLGMPGAIFWNGGPGDRRGTLDVTDFFRGKHGVYIYIHNIYIHIHTYIIYIYI